MKNNHKHVDFDTAHSFVEKANSDVFWDGYDIVIWRKNPSGYMVKNGMFRNETWGTARRIKMSDRGTWRVPATQ